ncbi:MAG: LPS export ABC transporter permease LptG [candidate division NC10 bacterium]|nr:LPS export ABC transporter permease LptG [candidate division NC10 bacterium]
MRILDRYIARECLKLLGLCLMVFVGVYLVVDLFEKLSRFLEARVGAELILRYYFFRLPRITIEMLPAAVLLSSLLTLSGMARYNELLAMKMGQVSTLRIAAPCILVGLLASGAAWGIAEHVAPGANEQALAIERMEVKRLPAYRLMQDRDIWYRAEGNRFVHIGVIETGTGVIRGMSVFRLSPTFDLLERVDAQEASWRGNEWELKEGYRLDERQSSPRVVAFQNLRLSLNERPEEFARVAPSPEEMSYAQLQAYIERLTRSGVSVLRFQVDLYAKGSIAAVSLVMALIGVSFGMRTGKGSTMLWVGACIPMGFVFWTLLSVGVSLGRTGTLPPLVAVWLANTVFALAGLFSLWRLRG